MPLTDNNGQLCYLGYKQSKSVIGCLKTTWRFLLPSLKVWT